MAVGRQMVFVAKQSAAQGIIRACGIAFGPGGSPPLFGPIPSLFLAKKCHFGALVMHLWLSI